MAATPTPTGAEWSHAISKDDHGPLVSIATSVMMAGMLLLLIIRMAIRWPWRQLLGFDDAMTLLGSMFAVGQSIAIFNAVHHGLGRRADDVDTIAKENVEQAIYAGDILFVFTLLASKLAVALLLFRLSSARQTIIAAYIMMATVGAWGFAAVLAVAIRPNTVQPWTMELENASRVVDVWTGVGAASALTELALVAFPIFLVWGLQMPIASKLTVIAGFGFRLPVAILAFLRIVSFREAPPTADDVTWDYVTLTIFTEIEMHFSLIAATIPCMHVFLKNFNTGYLGTTADQVDSNGTMAATKGSNSYVMSTVRSRHTQDPPEKTRQGGMKLRPDDGAITNTIEHRNPQGDNGTDAGSVTSDGSDKIIIRKTVRIDYGDSSR